MLTMSEIRSLTSGRHPARTLDFDTLYNGLQERVRQRYVNVQTNATRTMEIFNYSNSCTYDGAWDVFTLMSRGLVVDPVQRRVVATPFVKFFNFGELGYEVPDEPFIVETKWDGSLCIIFYHENEWHCATRGSFESPQAKWAMDWFRRHVKTKVLHPGYTYLAEIIFSANKIVVSYDFEGLVLLSAYNEWGNEMPREYLEEVSSEAGLRLVDTRSFNSIDDIIELAKTLPYQEEGFVVRFLDGFRLKIKGVEYIRIAKLVSRITPLGVWETMAKGDDLEQVRQVIPEEFRTDWNKIHELLEKEFTDRYQELQKAVDSTNSLSDKGLGQAIQGGSLSFRPDICTFVFACRKKGFLDKVKVAGSDRDRFFQLFRPTGNNLEGYKPTDTMNRFVEETG